MIRFGFTLILAISLVCGIFLVSYSYKRRAMPSAKYFILIIISMLIYNGGYIGEINSNQLSTALFWFNFEHIAIPIQPYLWIMMNLSYTRVLEKQKKLKYIMLFHPIAYFIIYFTDNMHHLYISSYQFISNGHFPVIVSQKGPLYCAIVVSITIFGLFCSGLYIWGYTKSTHFHRRGYIIMIIASLLQWVCIYINATSTNYLGIDYYPVVTVFSGILYMFGIFQYNIFNTIPIATETVYQQSKEGIVLIDITGHILDANGAVVNLYPELKAFKGKKTLESFVNLHTEFHSISDINNKIQYSLEVNGEIRYYSAELDKILSENGIIIGKILSISDITLFIEYQNKLELIATNAMEQAETNEMSFLQAQITPHFINNTLSVIASMITRDAIAAKDLVINLSEYLISCYHIDSSSPKIPLSQELEMVDTYVKIVKARFRDRLNFEVYNEIDTQIYIPRLAIQPLVENAINHGVLKKIEGGNVSLKIYCKDRLAFFEIYDDGVGMQEERIETLLDGKDNKQGVGLINVHRRLLKYYGNGLKITSIIGVSTTVSFSIPLS